MADNNKSNTDEERVINVIKGDYMVKFINKLDKIESFNHTNIRGEKVSIPKENMTRNIKVFIAILVTMKDEFFRKKNNTLDFDKIADKSIKELIKNFHLILYKFVLEILEEREENLSQFNKSEFFKYCESITSPIREKIDSMVDNLPATDFMPNMVNYVIYDEGDNAGKFEEQILKFIERTFAKGIEVGSGYVLDSELSPNTWKAVKNEKYYVLRFHELRDYFSEFEDLEDAKFDKEVKKLLKFTNAKEKLKAREYSKQHDIRRSLESISEIILPLLEVGYYAKGEMIYESMSFVENNITTLKNINKQDIVTKLISLLKKVHSTGFVLGNLTPEKILVEQVIKKNKTSYNLFLYDLSTAAYVLSPISRTLSGYDSLLLLSTKEKDSTFYDDIESMLYVINDILTDTKIEYFEKGDTAKESFLREKEFKTSLDPYAKIVVTAIKKIRIYAQNDEYANGEKEIDSKAEYGISLYKLKKNTITPFRILTDFRDKIESITKDEIYGTKMQEEIYNKFFNELSSNEEYNHLDSETISRYALQRTFSLIYGVTYPEEITEKEDSDVDN